jgi:DNA polymerase I-like protein with 3'-5' exonuclease and polymerase domains
MIDLPNGAKLITSAGELPDWRQAKELFLDIESQRNYKAKITAFDEDGFETDYSGLYPFGGDRIAGFAATVDDSEQVIYVPMRHTAIGSQNLPIENVQQWLRDHLTADKRWINHNVVLDATFVAHEGLMDMPPELCCTLTAAKMYDSDRMDQGLKILVPEYTGMPMPEEGKVQAYLKSIKSKSYADVPAYDMGWYATDDVIGNRKLYRFLQEKMPSQVQPIWETERRLTSVLYDMEVRGLQTDRRECTIKYAHALKEQLELSTMISMLTGREWTNSSQCVYDILTNKFGIPVLVTKWEKDKESRRYYDTGRATYDSDAMDVYAAHPLVLGNPLIKQVLDLILRYRHVAHFSGLFLEPFLKLMDAAERIHPTYNQLVRTGRMSCKRPNAQQQNDESKVLIKPGKGRCFFSCDYSQIEFRLIIHYIEDQAGIEAYKNDPWTDFHQWVADICGVKRSAGKTLNFGMGYGAGKKKVTSELVHDKNIIETIGQLVADMVRSGKITSEQANGVFTKLCEQRAAEVYNTYHERLPGVKRTSQEAAGAARYRGYVFNAYGRRRHLPLERAHIAFNTIVQGSAMDIIKEAMVRLSPRYNRRMRDWDIHIAANVHDEILFDAPEELMLNPEVHQYIISTMENPSVPFLVPIKTGLGVSKNHWCEAAGDDTVYSDGTVTDELYDGVKVAGRLIG